MSRQPSLYTMPPAAPASPSDRVWTVSALSARIRLSLEARFDDLWVEGEVSNVRVPASGHVYFTLKDASSQVRAVLFRGAAQKLRFALREGLQIIVRGSLTVYEPRGEYQIVVQTAEPKGIGALQLAFEQLKERLGKEGLFDSSRKRPLPFLPRAIGIVTSLSGAAIRDILAVLGRRCPSSRIIIAPTAVQGDGSGALIAQAISHLGHSGLVEVMIVGRGGGSMEDLWSFNEEAVVRAIAECPVPIVSAVGHEIDVTLADFAADYRAATPSAAAEAVTPVLADLVARVSELEQRVTAALRHVLGAWRQDIALIRSRLQQQRFPLHRQAQRLDELWTRLTDSVTDRVMLFRHRVQLRASELTLHSPRKVVREATLRVSHEEALMRERIGTALAARRQRLAGLMGSLDGLSPLATLERGYSVLQTVPEGRVVRRARDVRRHQLLKARVSVGHILCRVESTSADQEAP